MMRNSKDVKLGKWIVNYSLEVKRKLQTEVKCFLRVLSMSQEKRMDTSIVIISSGIIFMTDFLN